MPDGFAGTLAGLPKVSLAVLFAIQNRFVEGPWLEEGPMHGLEDSLVDTITCQLLYLDPTQPKHSKIDSVFEAFCAAMGAALPGFQLEFSRIEEEQSYIGRLP